ncbi:MAG: tRNA lysidine(34) synthetase TilS [Paludibacter sp.]|nr:MAG: tRNA lysidine(34) synthetase TilS [Paludibacter sp.]
MNLFLEKIKKNINNLIKGKSPIIIGVSGGIDSMVLLDVLYRLGYSIVVAHVNFKLRGKDSDSDEIFVSKMAKKMRLPIEKIHFNTQEYSKKNHISIEMSARKLRYDWFEELSKKYDTENIAVAHHADDNIETLILNLIRGTGIKGISGMKERNGKVIRPFLSIFRSEIEQYTQKNNIQYVSDATNFEDIYKRNKIRNQIIPLLEELNPSVRQTLYKNILNFDKSSEFYFHHIEKIKSTIVAIKNEVIYIDINKLLKLEHSHIVLYEVLSDYLFHSDTIEDIFTKLNKQSGIEFLSPTHRLIKDRNYLLIEKRIKKEKKRFQIDENSFDIKEPLTLKIKKIRKTTDFQYSTNPKIIHIDKLKVIFPLTIRRWQNGDTFQPLGMTNFKKVSDFFIDEKINKIEKENSWVLLNSNNQIIWIIGKRLDNRFKITNKTSEIIELKTN